MDDASDARRPHSTPTRLRLNDAFLVSAHGADGLTREALRTRAYLSPARGVRIPADSADPALSRLSAAALGSAPAAVITDISAARLWWLPLPPWIGLHDDELPVSVALAAGPNRPRRNGVRGRRLRLPADHVTTHRELTVTTPARTWLDCAALIPVEYIVAMGDVVLRRFPEQGELLESITRWGSGRRGIIAARQALPWLDARSESPGESIVRAHLVLGGVPRPRCNLDIFDAGMWIARADLAWPAQKVIVEYDGAAHLDEKRRRSDAQRRNLLIDAGWIVLTFTAADLRRPHAMVQLVRSALDSRARLR